MQSNEKKELERQKKKEQDDTVKKEIMQIHLQYTTLTIFFCLNLFLQQYRYYIMVFIT